MNFLILRSRTDSFAGWHLPDCLALLILPIIIFANFYGVLSGGWRGDDPAILWHAMNSSGLSSFYDPAGWKNLSPNNLTPWVTLSFKLDLWLAGLNPLFFYTHQLFSLYLVAGAGYVLARCWAPPAWALSFVLIFLAGAPTMGVAELLMTRHYLEGLFFAVLAVLAFVLAQRRQRLGWAMLGAVAYALAATAKEIFVPLSLVLVFIPPIGRVPERMRLLAPYFCVVVAYVIWRQYMLGTMIGGYVTLSIFELPSLLAQAIHSFASFPRLLLGLYWPIPTVILAATLSFYLYRRPASLPLALMLALCLLGPLMPLVIFPGINSPDRYLFLVWFVVCLVGVLSLRFAVLTMPGRKSVRYACVALACLATAAPLTSHVREVSTSHQSYFREFDVQGRFVLEANASQAWIPSPNITSGFWFVTQLCEIKRRAGSSCPTVLFKGIPPDEPVRQLYRYDPTQQRMMNISANLDEEVAQIMAIDETRPLAVWLSIENGSAAWQLGPYETGQYFFVSASLGRYPIPRVGSVKIGLTEVLLHVHHESPEGWITRSPLLGVKPGKSINWARPVELMQK